jgi:hypothetical protein
VSLVQRQLHFFVGSLFGLTGLVLALYGLISDPAIYARSLGWNVNLWWGLLMLVFGASFLLSWWSGRDR